MNFKLKVNYDLLFQLIPKKIENWQENDIKQWLNFIGIYNKLNNNNHN